MKNDDNYYSEDILTSLNNITNVCKEMSKSMFYYEKQRVIPLELINSFKVGLNESIKVMPYTSQDLFNIFSKKINTNNIIYTQSIDCLISSLKEINNQSNILNYRFKHDYLRSITESLQSMSDYVIKYQNEVLRQIDYSTVINDIVQNDSSLMDIVDNTYNIINKNNVVENDDSDDFTDKEINDSLKEQVINPEGFQSKFASWTNKKKVKYFIFFQILFFIYSNFFQPYFQQNIGVPVIAYTVAHVKELPNYTSKIIDNIDEDIEAFIVENIPYYYKVTFKDDAGKTKDGYVSKRSVKLINNKDEGDN